MTINKQTTIIAAFVLVVLSLGIGYFLGRADVPVQEIARQEEITRQEILAEIDQRFKEKARIGALPLPFDEVMLRERIFLSGEVMAPGMEDNRFKLKVFNFFEGGSFTEFLFQPDYFIKEIVVDQDTKIREIAFFVEIPEPFVEIPEPEEREISLDELREKIALSIQAEEPLQLEVEAKQAFVFGEDKLIPASEISFHRIQ